jgi:TRAP-type transport system small permease protein
VYTRFCNATETAARVVIAALVLAIVVITLAAVWYRYALNSPIAWTEQVSRMMFVWVTFLGAAVLYRLNLHINVDFFLTLLPRLPCRIVIIVNDLLLLLLFGVLFYFGLLFTIANLGQRFGALDVSPSVFYVAAPVTAFLCILYWIERVVVRRAWFDPTPSFGGSSF